MNLDELLKHPEIKILKAEVGDSGLLWLQFPTLGYKVLPQKSVVEDGIWKLYIEAPNPEKRRATLLYDIFIVVPDGVEKVVVGEVVYGNNS